MLGGSGFDHNEAMINLFELSTGMASTKVLSERAHREGSPVHRSRTDINKAGDPAKFCVEDKLVSLQEASTRSSLSNKADLSPMKTRKPPSVVARLMGLEDDLPGQEQALHSAKSNLRRSHSQDCLAATSRAMRQQEQHQKTTRDTRISPKETVEFKDVYAICEEPLRTHHIQDQTSSEGGSSRNKNDTRIEVVREKFIEAKRLATDENFLHSKEFQDALEVLSSNKDLFLRFLEEPSSVISNQRNGQRAVPAPPQTKHITVLKPFKYVENKGVRETRAGRVNEENDFVMGNSHKRSHSAEDTCLQTNRIVVLKPSPGKPNRTHARLTPRLALSELAQRTDFLGDLKDTSTLRYDEAMDTLVQYLPEDLHQRDESLLSSVYSNGYIGDESSFSRSEDDYIDEDGGSLSDSEIVSPVSQNSWDYIKRYSSAYSSSAYSRTSRSHSAESSVIKEAKKRLSDRWTTVAGDGVIQQVKLPRRSRTLGDMLSLREAEKEETIVALNTASTSQSCGTENEFATQATCIATFREAEKGETSPRNLSRSKSLPVSSAAFHNMVVSGNSEGCKASKVDAGVGKEKLSFKGKVSSFFFPRSKRPAKEETILPSDISDEIVEVRFLGDKRPKTNHVLKVDEQMEFCNDKADNFNIQTSCSPRQVVGSMEAPVSSSGYTDEPRSKCMCGELSSTSVRDPSFENSTTNEPESSRSTSCCNDRGLLRSPTIEYVPRSSSWEDTNSSSALHGSLSFFSNADDDESECYALVQKIVSAAGLGNLQVSMGFTGWYLADCPLDPALCDKFLDRKEEAAKSRERRSNQKLLFDCVNMALVETGQDALRNAYPLDKACFGAWRETPSQDLGEEVWHHVRGWLYGAESFMANEYGDAAAMLERIVHQEVKGGCWMESARSEADLTMKQIAVSLLEELVGEAVAGLAVYFPQQGIPVPMQNL